eukprot:CAMPEP_0180428502 /NCGR_PEP_ID=MMETSP1036_2-20121128/6868_1 /TAXON_ID=632150 /ORGANISM="Azadinium spinosum, Strain 3D9" /LENGTH=88 /DNA_ID=CAMNT_0022434137 /DNA_START=901 /DNA_END=1167 /DNA_ORIENTATION=-
MSLRVLLPLQLAVTLLPALLFLHLRIVVREVLRVRPRHASSRISIWLPIVASNSMPLRSPDCGCACCSRCAAASVTTASVAVAQAWAE